jgi:iron(III) transport system substrate-binding protein
MILSARVGKLVLALLLAGTAGPAFAEEAWQKQPFDLDAVIAAAKAEPPITIYDTSGKVVGVAEGFTAKYGVEATGRKVDANAQIDMIIREAQSGNIQADVVRLADGTAAAAQLLPQGFVESWLPPNLADSIIPAYQNPLALATNATVWVYNTEVYDHCPISNIWQLTQPEWQGKVVINDPLSKGIYPDWFNQMATHGDDKVATAYQALEGKPLETDESSATAAWVGAFAANHPVIVASDEGVAEAVGAPGQEAPPFGLISPSMFRHNADKGYKLGLCTGMQPWIGSTYVKSELIATGTKSPNAARLFVYYSLTDEGMEALVADSNIPTNKDIALPADNPSGLFDHVDQLLAYDITTSIDDWDAREDWGDFWRTHYK